VAVGDWLDEKHFVVKQLGGYDIVESICTYYHHNRSRPLARVVELVVQAPTATNPEVHDAARSGRAV
jgi:hypothetical protein